MSRPPADNAVLTVTAVTRALQGLVEPALAEVWVRGEVTNCRQQSSGHWYFCLKDAENTLQAVLFAGEAARQVVRPREGMDLTVFGRLAIYGARSQYQVIARLLVDTGFGALQQRFEELKRRLAAEGLFSPERKRPLPSLPKTVGIVTSPTGAAVRDFLSVLERRGWRGRVVVLGAKVQGPGAAEEIAGMVARANRERLCDLLVVGRGGGSLEDLWAFNEEVVVRALVASDIPTISAVGHEIDVTLSDLTADYRAETPTAAAEWLASRQREARERTARARQRAVRALGHFLEARRGRIRLARQQVAAHHPRRLLERERQRLDDLREEATAAVSEALRVRREGVLALANRRARRSPRNLLDLQRERLRQLSLRLQSVSPGATLRRGFVLLRDESGRIVSRRGQTRKNQVLIAEFHDGVRKLRVDERPEQGMLFE